MTPEANSRFKSASRIALPVALAAIILLLFLPIPAAVLDVLIVINVVASLIILMTAMGLKKPLDFSVFPTLLLVATVFRLTLSIASTRLVLSDGYAGEVINAMGTIVTAGSLVIGFVIFAVLTVIQLLVITKGAERVTQVKARFALDAMPGKQMAVDADINSGALDEEAAKARRQEISSEADFYGAMDGASKFVKGDAIAAVVITLINIIGGISVGLLMRGMPIGEALSLYTVLTIGDGLVTMIPAILMSVATGMIVTRSGEDADTGTQAAAQLSQSRVALLVAGAVALALAVVPGMPAVVCIVIGGAMLIWAQRMKTSDQKKAAAEAAAQKATEAAAPPRALTTEDLVEEMRVHEVEVFLAAELVDLVASNELRHTMATMRRNIAADLGLLVTGVQLVDDASLGDSEYIIRIAGSEVGRGILPRSRVLAVGGTLAALPGTPYVDPVIQQEGKWVPVEASHRAEMAGATVFDRVSVLVTHLDDTIRANAGSVLTLESVRVMTDLLKDRSPAAVEALTPEPLSLVQILEVLKALLDEGVSIRNLDRIFEGLAMAARTKQAAGSPIVGVDFLVEAARLAVASAVTGPYVHDGRLAGFTLHPDVSGWLATSLKQGPDGNRMLAGGSDLTALCQQIRDDYAALSVQHGPVVLVVSSELRWALRRQIHTVPVLSDAEVVRAKVRFDFVGLTEAPMLEAMGSASAV